MRYKLIIFREIHGIQCTGDRRASTILVEKSVYSVSQRFRPELKVNNDLAPNVTYVKLVKHVIMLKSKNVSSYLFYNRRCKNLSVTK